MRLPRRCLDFAARPRALASIAVLYMAAFAVLMGVSGSTPWLAGVAYHVAPVAAALLSLRAAARTRGERRFGWAAMTVAATSWGVAEGFYAIYAFRGTDAPFPSAADGFYLSGYLALIVAIPFVSGMPRGLRDPRLLVDGATVVIAATAFYWHYLIQPVAYAGDVKFAAAAVATAYPVLDLAVLAFIVLSFYGCGRRFSVQGGMVALASVILVATDSLYSAQVISTDSVPTLSVLDLGWLSAYWLVAIAAVSPAATLEARVRRPAWIVPVLPHLVTVPLVVDVGIRLAQDDVARGLSAGALAAVISLLVRQWFTQRDNVQLLERERALTGSLEQAVADLERLRAEAEYLAERDHLTELLNRRAWELRARDITPTAVAVLDIDHFKTVNDVFGHVVGDQVLRIVSRRLVASLPGSHIGRLGGEEFGVLFTCQYEMAVTLLDEALAAIASEVCPIGSGEGLRVTISAGIAPWTESSDRHRALERAYATADRELYVAKAAGRTLPASIKQRGAA